MKRTPLRVIQALQQGWSGLWACPAGLIGFCAAGLGLHLIGWGLFSAGQLVESTVLALLLDAVGLSLYLASLAWLVEGMTRAGLSLAAGQALAWRTLYRWPSPRSLALSIGMAYLLLALIATAVAGFLAWSLLVLVLPPLGAVAALLTLIAITGLAISQLFMACLVVSAKLRPSQALRTGLRLLEHHGFGLVKLAAVLMALLLVPLGAGLVAVGISSEQLRETSVLLATLATLLMIVPLLALTTTAAYRQLAFSESDR